MGNFGIGIGLGALIVYLISLWWHLRKRFPTPRQFKFDLNKSLKEILKEFSICEYCKHLMDKTSVFCKNCGKRNWKLFIDNLKRRG